MRDVLNVVLKQSLFGNPSYRELTADEKNEICDMFWNQIEDAGAIPLRGYGLQVTETGFTIDGDLNYVDEASIRSILDEYSDYEYSIHRAVR